MQFRQFTSIQVALGAYVHRSVCLPFANWMHGWKDGRILQMDGSVQAQSSVHWYNALSNVLFFFSLEALLLGKAVAQIFRVLWPSLLGRWPLARRTRQTTSGYKDQQHEKQHKQNPQYCHNLSHPSSTTPSHMIKPKKMKVMYHVNPYDTTAPLHPSVSTPFHPTFLQLPLVRITKLQRQKVPTSAIWIPTPVFASLSASIARNLRLPCLLQLLLPCPPWPSVTGMT